MSKLKARCAAALGWSERDADGFSLAAIRDLVRPVDAALAAECDAAIRSGRVVVWEEDEPGDVRNEYRGETIIDSLRALSEGAAATKEGSGHE